MDKQLRNSEDAKLFDGLIPTITRFDWRIGGLHVGSHPQLNLECSLSMGGYPTGRKTQTVRHDR
jgi:hypothetical protein